ncbi:hypothetical protein AAF712_011622 [Marasmius tenuissimus]|uniref:Uncharacterized protein n=1 Tax=Marasmius tenuissimus TaxID=585030 RepID=A0ABR2ZJX2_9AGAR
MPSPIPGPSGVQQTPSPTPPRLSRSQQPGRKRKPTVPLKKGTRGMTKKQKRMKVNKFTKEHVPEDAVGTRKAFEVHLCVTAVINSIDSLPVLSTLKEKKEFLKGMGKVNAFLDRNLAKFNIINNKVNARIDCLKTAAQSFNHLQQDITRVPQNALQAISASFMKLGIECICIDTSEDPLSMCNTVMQRIMIHMFQLAIGCGEYVNHGLDNTWWKNDAWLNTLFDHYFFEHLERK